MNTIASTDVTAPAVLRVAKPSATAMTGSTGVSTPSPSTVRSASPVPRPAVGTP